MTVYRAITHKALHHLNEGDTSNEAWKRAAHSTPCQAATRDKGCPRSAFVSLAEGGYLPAYAPPFQQTTVSLNAQYCLTALDLLALDPTLQHNKSALWQAVRQRTGAKRQNQNGVMDVVLALVEQQAITPRTRS